MTLELHTETAYVQGELIVRIGHGLIPPCSAFFHMSCGDAQTEPTDMWRP